MPNLVFIRHSQSQPDPEIPARSWRLTEEGRQRCEPLAALLIPYNLDTIITSTEPKAIETGQLVAQKLGIPYQLADNIHEHSGTPHPILIAGKNFWKR
jgi:broad specificity phosphatase PhoE